MDRAHRIAVKQEKVTAANHGGRGTPASGSGDVKNDVRNDDFSFEVKFTTRKSYALSLEELRTAERHALADGRRMAFIVSYDQGVGKLPRRFIVLDENDFIELVGDVQG
jgi:hypothetical protein